MNARARVFSARESETKVKGNATAPNTSVREVGSHKGIPIKYRSTGEPPGRETETQMSTPRRDAPTDRASSPRSPFPHFWRLPPSLSFLCRPSRRGYPTTRTCTAGCCGPYFDLSALADSVGIPMESSATYPQTIGDQPLDVPQFCSNPSTRIEPFCSSVGEGEATAPTTSSGEAEATKQPHTSNQGNLYQSTGGPPREKHKAKPR